MSISESAAAYGAVAAILAIGAMVVNVFLGKHIKPLGKLLVVTQWVLAVGSVGAAVVALSDLMGGQAHWTIVALLFTVILAVIGLIALLVAALVLDRRDDQAVAEKVKDCPDQESDREDQVQAESP